MASLLEKIGGGRGREIDQAVGDTYTAAPSQTVGREEVAPDTSGQEFPVPPQEGFSKRPLRGAIIRRTEDGGFKRWSEAGQQWAPVKTFYFKPLETTYWWDDKTSTFYPFKAEE